MTGVLIDTNVLVYAAGDDELAEGCRALLRAAVEGRIEGRCSTAIMEELWHLELGGRLPQLAGQTELALEALSPLLPVTEAIFRDALKLQAPSVGANDRIHVATARAAGLEAIVSADRGFDEVALIERIDVLDGNARAELIGSG